MKMPDQPNDLANSVFSSELPAYISVDVETAGPVPSQYSLLSIGACTLTEPRRTFYVELKPENDRFVPEALEICQLSMETLAKDGLLPLEALRRFEAWLVEVLPPGIAPIFVAFNAPFDWMFINDYFHRYLGRNPFGHSALDIKAAFLGARRIPWYKTSFRSLIQRYHEEGGHKHQALEDAIDQGELFKRLLMELTAI
jgi:DNA polymerase III epsilon subunit-like protein